MEKYQMFLIDYRMAAQEMKRLIDDYLEGQIDSKTFQDIILYWVENYSDKIFLDFKERTFPVTLERTVGKRRLDYFLTLIDAKKIS